MENAVQIRGATAQDAQVFFALNLAFNGEGVASPQEAALALAHPGPERVLLAFALEPMPDMLLLDEPVSAVDRKGIEVFYDLVTSLRSEYHMPVILVSHDLSHVARYATRAALLDRTILVSGDVKTVMASPQVRETFGLDVVGGARA